MKVFLLWILSSSTEIASLHESLEACEIERGLLIGSREVVGVMADCDEIYVGDLL